MKKIDITIILATIGLSIATFYSLSYAQSCPPGSHVSYCEQNGSQQICHCVRD